MSYDRKHITYSNPCLKIKCESRHHQSTNKRAQVPSMFIQMIKNRKGTKRSKQGGHDTNSYNNQLINCIDQYHFDFLCKLKFKLEAPKENHIYSNE
jgi:hypothetical protein